VASIPTSLLVVWFALQSMLPQYIARAEPRTATVQAEPPRVVVVQPPPPGPVQTPAYASPQWGAQSYAAMPALGARPPRKFTVIGGVSEAEELNSLQALESDL
jgi:hypothetical protein